MNDFGRNLAIGVVLLMAVGTVMYWPTYQAVRLEREASAAFERDVEDTRTRLLDRLRKEGAPETEGQRVRLMIREYATVVDRHVGSKAPRFAKSMQVTDGILADLEVLMSRVERLDELNLSLAEIRPIDMDDPEVAKRTLAELAELRAFATTQEAELQRSLESARAAIGQSGLADNQRISLWQMAQSVFTGHSHSLERLKARDAEYAALTAVVAFLDQKRSVWKPEGDKVLFDRQQDFTDFQALVSTYKYSRPRG